MKDGSIYISSIVHRSFDDLMPKDAVDDELPVYREVARIPLGRIGGVLVTRTDYKLESPGGGPLGRIVPEITVRHVLDLA